jgi:hypothetical protein
VASQRNPVYDLLRGYFLIVILIDHLSRWPSLFQFISGRGELWVTAAEGFFFISGLMIGIIRGRDVARRGFQTAAKKLASRGVQLYGVAVGMTLLVTAIGRALLHFDTGGYKAGLDGYNSWSHIIGQTLSLHYLYGWTDFLYYYAIYMIAAIPVLWLLSRRRWGIVASISVGLFLLAKYVATSPDNYWWIWQLYFVGGVMIGFYRKELGRAYAKVDQTMRRSLENGLVLVGLALLGISALYTFWSPLEGRSWVEYWLQTSRSGQLRPAAFAVVFAALFIMADRYQGWVVAKLGWLLLPLGQRSLYVYCLEGLLLFVMGYNLVPDSLLINTGVTLVSIAAIWYGAKIKPRSRPAAKPASLPNWQPAINASD